MKKNQHDINITINISVKLNGKHKKKEYTDKESDEKDSDDKESDETDEIKTHIFVT